MLGRFYPLIARVGRGFATTSSSQSQPVGTKIRAAVSTGPKQPFVIEDLVLDEPRAGEVLIKVTACGICHTDLVWYTVNSF
jgi:Alcohol dehydrogenase GroES-like domain